MLSLSAVTSSIHCIVCVCLFTWMKSPVTPRRPRRSTIFILCRSNHSILAIAITEIQATCVNLHLGARPGRPSIAMISPMTVLGILVSEVPSTFPVWRGPARCAILYAIHVLRHCLAQSWAIARRQGKLQPEYLSMSVRWRRCHEAPNAITVDGWSGCLLLHRCLPAHVREPCGRGTDHARPSCASDVDTGGTRCRSDGGVGRDGG